MGAEYKPYLKIPAPVAWSKTLSTKAKLVWAQIKFHRNHETGNCFPSYHTIADRLHIGERTVCRAVNELRRAGLLISRKHVRASTYEVYEIEQCVENADQLPEKALDAGFRHAKMASLDTPKWRLYIEPTQVEPAQAAAAERLPVVATPEAENQDKSQAQKIAAAQNPKPEPPKPAAPARDSTPAAFAIALRERHGARFAAEDCIAAVRRQLEKRGIEFAEFIEWDRVQTTHTGQSNPAGYYVSLAKQLRQKAIAEAHDALRPLLQQMTMPDPPRDEKGRCAPCGGVGKVADGSYCECQLGRDLAAVARRPIRSETSISRAAGKEVQHEKIKQAS